MKLLNFSVISTFTVLTISCAKINDGSEVNQGYASNENNAEVCLTPVEDSVEAGYSFEYNFKGGSNETCTLIIFGGTRCDKDLTKDTIFNVEIDEEYGIGLESLENECNPIGIDCTQNLEVVSRENLLIEVISATPKIQFCDEK